MKIDDGVRKAVLFVGLRMADGTFVLKGTAFLLGVAEDLQFLVTARHVIDGIRRAGLEVVWIRINPVGNGDAFWAPTQLESWVVHATDATVDVAVAKMEFPMAVDHLCIPHTMGATPEIFAENHVGIGDEVFIAGLFQHHHGMRRSIPIVRIGNLVCMTEERVTTDLGDIDAYLIEARSIGGLSGSPVFLEMGNVRQIGAAFVVGPGAPAGTFLLGLIHGHYDELGQEQANEGDGERYSKINSGIAIVVPFRSVLAVIEQWQRGRNAAMGFGPLRPAPPLRLG